MVSYHYEKYGQDHRRVYFREDENHAIWVKDPATGEEIEVGKLVRAPGALIVILMPPHAS